MAEHVSVLHKNVALRLTKWRNKDDLLDRGTWRGVSEIAGAVQYPKPIVRHVLRALADSGHVEFLDTTGGGYWRASLNHTKV